MAITVLQNNSSENSLAGASSADGAWGIGTIAGPASYATGGFAADIATDFGLSTEPDFVTITVQQADATRAYDAIWDFTNKKIVVYTAGTTTDTTATTDLSAETFLIFWSRAET